MVVAYDRLCLVSQDAASRNRAMQDVQVAPAVRWRPDVERRVESAQLREPGTAQREVGADAEMVRPETRTLVHPVLLKLARPHPLSHPPVVVLEDDLGVGLQFAGNHQSRDALHRIVGKGLSDGP